MVSRYVNYRMAEGFFQPILIHSVGRYNKRTGNNEKKLGRRKYQRITADFSVSEMRFL